jgi:hypothetical protein
LRIWYPFQQRCQREREKERGNELDYMKPRTLAETSQSEEQQDGRDLRSSTEAPVILAGMPNTKKKQK